MLDAYVRHLVGNEVTPKQVQQARRRCEVVLAGTGAAVLHQLDGDAADGWLGDQQRTRARLVPSTRNGHVKALKAFGNWLVTSRKASENRFRYVSTVNAR